MNDNVLNSILEKIVQGYNCAWKEWLADRKNLFKDGKLLGYYEVKEAVVHMQNKEDTLNDALETIAELYSRAKTEWLSDRRNAFKDGKFLACYEILNMVPAAN